VLPRRRPAGKNGAVGGPVRFVGRVDELATLGSVLARAEADPVLSGPGAESARRGAVVTVVGEPGTGKTALVEAATIGRRTVWARAREGGAPPMWLWEQVFGQLGPASTASGSSTPSPAAWCGCTRPIRP